MEIFWICAAITILGLAGYGLQLFAVRSYIPHRSLDSGGGDSLPRSFPPISILKPLRGLDDNLFDNLRSICDQDYPRYEVIFALQDYNDPAFKVALKIRERYPEKDIAIVVEHCDDGLNPKVNNLIPAYKAARYEHILISDSNVMVDKYYLREISRPMNEPGIGLVSNLIRGVGARSLGSLFENLHLNSFVMGSVCFLDKFLGMPCVVGKSMLMRKKDIEAIGGLKAFKDVLAEDYLIGRRIQESGKGVVLSRYVINNVNHYWGIRQFVNRHTRWGKLRWKIGGAKYLSELLGNAVFMSALPVVLWEPSRMTVSFALLVALLKICGDLYVGRRVASDLNPFLYLLSPLKDLIIGVMWFAPIFSNAVVWRGNRYVIGKDSQLSPSPEIGIWSWRYRFVDAIRERLA